MFPIQTLYKIRRYKLVLYHCYMSYIFTGVKKKLHEIYVDNITLSHQFA